MARLQILELPEGASDERSPFVLVVDQSEPQRWVLGSGVAPVPDHWHTVAAEIGARGVIVTPETVEIPANDVSEVFRAEMQSTVGDLYESARQSLSESETLGHRLLQRAEYAEAVTAQTKGLMERRTRTLGERAEAAEAGRVAADNMLRAVCEVFGGPHVDPVVKVRETIARAEAAEAKLQAFAEGQQRELVDRMDEVTDALGLDRLRDWGELVTALRAYRVTAEQLTADGGHQFDVPGYLDPQRCARCGSDRQAWIFGHDRRTCNSVRVDSKSGHDFRPIGVDHSLACRRCGLPRGEWVARRDSPKCDAEITTKRGS